MIKLHHSSLFYSLTLAAVALAALGSPLAAQAIDDADPINARSAELFLRAGALYPLSSWPASANEIIRALGRLAADEPSFSEEATLLIEELKGRSDGSYASIAFALASRLDGFDRALPSEPAKTYDTRMRYIDAPPIARLDLGHADPRGIHADLSVRFRKEWSGDFSQKTNLPSLGAESNPLAIDNHVMERADLRLDRGVLGFAFGRSPVKFGSSGFHSLYPDDGIPYLDRIGLSVRDGALGFDWYVATIQPIRSYDGYDIAPADQLEGGDDQRPTVLTAKRIALYRPNFRFGIGQLAVYSRSNAYYTITDFIPLLDLHSSDVKPNNLSFILEFGWVPSPGLELYTTIGLDEISGDTFGIADSEIPTIWAAVFGAKGMLKLPSFDAILRPSIQLGYAHYLWGNYDAAASSHGDAPSDLAKAVYRYRLDNGSILMPLTSPFGPGAAWIELDASLSAAGFPIRLGLEALILAKHPLADLVATPYAQDTALSRFPPFALAALGLDLAYSRGNTALSVKPTAYGFADRISFSLEVGYALKFGARFHGGVAEPKP